VHISRTAHLFSDLDQLTWPELSFRVDAGEVFGWLGPNGAGKTTTIRILLGLMSPTAGSTFVLRLKSATQTQAMHAHVGYMTQQFTLFVRNAACSRRSLRSWLSFGAERRQQPWRGAPSPRT
jgi:ABC-type Na+ transport system ATPase subunit NatA